MWAAPPRRILVRVRLEVYFSFPEWEFFQARKFFPGLGIYEVAFFPEWESAIALTFSFNFSASEAVFYYVVYYVFSRS